MRRQRTEDDTFRRSTRATRTAGANLLTPQSLATLKIEIRPFLFPLAARVIDTCSESCG